jgi:hypothetical protein
MWSFTDEALPGLRATKIRVCTSADELRYAEVLSLWQSSHDFRDSFIARLAAMPFAAFRWETPALTTATVERPFECVVVDAPELAAVPDQRSFAEHFDRGVDDVAVFCNLGGDSTLVVPCPLVDASAYAHLAVFLRRAPAAQKHALWQRVGACVEQRLSSAPLWLSTAGAGVSWLHVRLDARPKYYVYAPYRAVT